MYMSESIVSIGKIGRNLFNRHETADESYTSTTNVQNQEKSLLRNKKGLEPSTSKDNNTEEFLFYRVTELEMEINFLKSKYLKEKISTKNLSPEKQLLLENDWLEIQIREIKYKCDDMEIAFNAMKKDYANVITALLKAQHEKTETFEIHEMRELLRNRKNDAYEVNCLIRELNKVAWEMLPQKIADSCRDVDRQMDDLRMKYEELQFSSHNLRVSITGTKRELLALNVTINEETLKSGMLEMKIRNIRKIKQNWNNRLKKINKRLNVASGILASYGLTMDSFKNVNGQRILIKSTCDTITDPESLDVKVDDKTPLEKRLNELVLEITKAKAEHDMIQSRNISKVEDIKKLEIFKNEIKSLKTIRDRFKTYLYQEIILRKSYYNEIEDLKGKIRVYCRCRPISKGEMDNGNSKCIHFPDIYTVTVSGLNSDRNKKEFQFDKVFAPNCTQEEVFVDSSKLIQSAFDGFNVCIFAYGQTGSGKTYTLIGNLESNPGIVPRAFNTIFRIVEDGKIKFKTELHCYMLELYNEKLLDLMTPGAEYSDKLEIKKDVNGMVLIPGAELLPATDVTALTELFIRGNRNRHIASTKMNSESSRSHLIISIMISCRIESSNKLVSGKMSIIDLAGSERLGKSGVQGVGAQEAMSINMSLSALGDVISALTSGQPFIPYRNNKLTMLMQDSLGGNAKTLMFVNISPVDYNRIETISSLTYAARVKLIKNDALKVSDPDEIFKLQNLLERLSKGEDVII